MTTKSRILLVDDDPDILRLLAIRLRGAGYEVDSASNGDQALARIPLYRPHLVITDLQMEGMDGITLFEQIHESQATLPVIMLTAHGTIPDAVEATKRGIFSYLTKPFDSKQLIEAVKNGLSQSGGTSALIEDDTDYQWRIDIISRSAVMESLLGQAKMVANSDVSVFIQSESGTGKELLAKAIHKASPRRDKPFIAVNCAAIPEQLLESELFGHAKGSFTGATTAHTGLVQIADGGTLFLDEIGDMPLPFQTKLLRLIQEREVRPVGSTRTIPVDIRIISATHQDLEKAIQRGSFREDLFYRLNVVLLELPPLAERREDIPLLSSDFLKQICAKNNSEAKRFSPDALEEMIAAPWPGNVRQLFNVVEQSVALSPSPIIPVNLVRRALRSKTREIISFADARARFEREYLVQLLQITEGNVTQATRLANRNRTEFYKLLSRHHLEPKLFRTPK
jgi:two-component system response regulator GlrR